MSQAGGHSIRVPLPKALPSAARRKVEAAIESHLAAVTALTAFLDETDGDADLEPSLANTSGDDREGDPADPPEHVGIDDNELDVSYNEGHGRGGVASTLHDDQEAELGWPEQMNQERALKSCRDGFSFDGEPSLGSLDGQINQNLWSHGNRVDLEDEHDGREPEDGI